MYREKVFLARKMIWSFILSLKMKCIWRRCCFWKLFDFNQDKAGAPFLLSSIIIMHLKKWWKTETLKWFPDKKLRCIFPNLGQKLNEFWENCIFATEVRSFLSAQKYLIFQLFYHFSQCLKIAQNVTFELFNFGIFHQFLSNQIDLPGNTFWSQTR